MLIIHLYLSFWMPYQLLVHDHQHELVKPYWVAQAVMDAAIIIGIGGSRRIEPIENLNPELVLRDPNPDDKPLSRRKKFIQEYVNYNLSRMSRL